MTDIEIVRRLANVETALLATLASYEALQDALAPLRIEDIDGPALASGLKPSMDVISGAIASVRGALDEYTASRKGTR